MNFLFDDAIVDRSEGTRRVLGQPRKQPDPVLEFHAPWENAGVHALHALRHDPATGRYGLWYRAKMHGASAAGSGGTAVDQTERGSARLRTFICYAESADAIRWERPELGLFDFDGRRDNNILAEATDDSAFYNVVYDPDDEERRFKAIGYSHARSSVSGSGDFVGIVTSFSRDGLRWTEPVGVVDGRQDVTDADFVLPCRDPATRRWVGFFRPRTRPKRRFIGVSESEDFIHWSPPRMLLAPGAEDTPWTEFYGLPVTLVAGCRVGLLWVFHNNPERSVMTNELVYSRCGQEYHRAMPRREFIPLGGDGEPDCRQVWPIGFVQRESDLLIYYNAGNVEHGSDRLNATTPGRMTPGRVAQGQSPRRYVGVARLPWGHFCGRRADDAGMVETTWLCNYGEAGVEVAAEISPGGDLRAEMLDVYGCPMSGWDAARCRLERTDRGTFRLIWGDNRTGRCGQTSPEGSAIGRVVKLRFRMSNATLYGVGVGGPDGDGGVTPSVR